MVVAAILQPFDPLAVFDWAEFVATELEDIGHVLKGDELPMDHMEHATVALFPHGCLDESMANQVDGSECDAEDTIRPATRANHALEEENR